MRRALSFSSATCARATLLVACAAACAAQSPVRQPSASSPPVAQTQTRAPQTTNAVSATPGEANEDFDLNISERRITEHNFFGSTELSAGDESARGLDLRVGVAVGAEQIDVLLRNVQGHVRFRASLDALRRVLDARHAAATNESPPSVP